MKLAILISLLISAQARAYDYALDVNGNGMVEITGNCDSGKPFHKYFEQSQVETVHAWMISECTEEKQPVPQKELPKKIEVKD